MGLSVNRLLCVFVGLTALTYAGTVNIGVRIFPAEVFLIIFLLFFPQYWVRNLTTFRRSDLVAIGILVIYFAESFISFAFPDPRMNIAGTYKELARLAVCFLAFMLVLGWRNRNQYSTYVLQKAFVISSSLVSVYGIYQSGMTHVFHSYFSLLPGSSDVPTLNGRAVGTFYEGGYMALYVGSSIILLLRYKSYYSSYAYMLHMSANILALILTQSTAGILCMIISLIYINYRFRINLRSLIWSAVIVLISIASYTVFKPKIDAVTKFVSTMDYGLLQGGLGSLSAADRITKIIKGFNMFMEHPILGVGIGQYSWLYNSYSPPSLSEDLGTVVPLNVYIQILAENGIVGLSIISSFVVFIWMKTNRSGRGLLLFVLLSMNFYPTYKYVFLWVLLALAFTEPKEKRIIKMKYDHFLQNTGRQ